MKLVGKMCYITGGSSGIGLAIAAQARQRGASLVLIARNLQGLQDAAKQLQQLHPSCATIATIACDVSNREICQQRLLSAFEQWGVPDILVNNAGMVVAAPFVEQSYEQLMAMMECNFLAPWSILQITVPRMLERGSGCVVNVSSMAGLMGIFGYAGYAASKGALALMSQVLRNELAPRGLRVLLLCPGDTLTAQLRAENLTKPAEAKKIAALLPPLKAETVAACLFRSLEHGRAFYVVPGLLNHLSWLIYRWLPQLIHQIIDKDVRSVWRGKLKRAGNKAIHR